MVLLRPGGLVTSQKRQQATTMQLSARGFDEKCAATARPDDQVDFLD
jgi:hypothetical protein